MERIYRTSQLRLVAQGREFDVEEMEEYETSDPLGRIQSGIADEEEKQRLALDPSTPPEVLKQLAEDENVKVRAWVSENPSTPPEVLRQLAQDGASWVRMEVAENLNAPRDVLAQLAQDENANVRGAAQENPNYRGHRTSQLRLLAQGREFDVEEMEEFSTTPEGLALSEDVRTRERVAGDPSTPPEVLKQLARDEDWGVRAAVAKNFNTPSSVLRQLAQDEDVAVRLNVADNPNTPREVLQQLARDEDGDVQEAAQENLDYREL